MEISFIRAVERLVTAGEETCGNIVTKGTETVEEASNPQNLIN